MQIALLLAYPVLAHLSVLQHSTWLTCAALLALAGSCLWPGLSAGRRGAQAAALMLAAVIVGLSWSGYAAQALLLPPVAICAGVFWLFASSLRPQQEPLVTRIARAERGSLTPELESYTRGVTWLWSITMFALTLASAGLALYGSPAAWSLFTNFISYAVMVAVFAGEYAWRRYRFRNLTHPRLRDHLRRVAQLRGHPPA